MRQDFARQDNPIKPKFAQELLHEVALKDISAHGQAVHLNSPATRTNFDG